MMLYFTQHMTSLFCLFSCQQQPIEAFLPDRYYLPSPPKPEQDDIFYAINVDKEKDDDNITLAFYQKASSNDVFQVHILLKRNIVPKKPMKLKFTFHLTLESPVPGEKDNRQIEFTIHDQLPFELVKLDFKLQLDQWCREIIAAEEAKKNRVSLPRRILREEKLIAPTTDDFYQAPKAQLTTAIPHSRKKTLTNLSRDY